MASFSIVAESIAIPLFAVPLPLEEKISNEAEMIMKQL